MEILFHYLDRLVGGSFSSDDLDLLPDSFDLACRRGFKKMQLALGNKGNTKQSLASKSGILISASDPCPQ